MIGFAWDGTNIFTFQGSGGIYQFYPQDSSFSFTCGIPSYYQTYPHGPPLDNSGLTYKSPNFVTTQMQMHTYGYPSVTMEFGQNGTLGPAHACPDPWMNEIWWDTDHFWGCESGSHKLVKFDAGGNILSTIDSIGPGIQNLFAQGQTLWIGGVNDSLVRINDSGVVLESHACIFGHPGSIFSDGTYIWYCGSYWENQHGHSKILKVDLNGSGTPLMQLSGSAYDFGIVQLQDSSQWNCRIKNPGQGLLTIDHLTIPAGMPFSMPVSFPMTIQPGDSVTVTFTFSPQASGRYNASLVFHSNDPIYTNQVVDLSGIGVYPGVHFKVAVPDHDYGPRRLKSTTGWKLRVVNNGSQPLIVNNITSGDNAFYPDRYISFPVDLPVLDTIDLRIWFQPREEKDYSGTITLHSNSATQDPFQISLHGTGKDSVYQLGSQLWSYIVPPYTDRAGVDDYPVAIIETGDVTGDSIPDLVINFRSGWTVCLNGNASGSPDVIWANFIFYGYCRDQEAMAVIPDIDGDGLNDIIIAPWSADTLYAWSGRTGKLIWKHDFYMSEQEQINVHYDYNGDGIPDVLLALSYQTYYNCGKPTNVICLDGKTGSVIWSATTMLCAYSVKGVEDFTGDGKPDVIAGISNFDKDPAKLYGIEGTNGHVSWSAVSTAAMSLMQIGDITGDGIRDVAAAEMTYDNTAYLSLVDATNGESKCFEWKGPQRFSMKMENMGFVSGDTTKGLLFSGCDKSNVNYIPSCWGYWEYPAWNATISGDLNGDSINDLFYAVYNQSGVIDTIGYLDGKNGHLLQSATIGNHVSLACPFIDLTGKGYPSVVVGGIGYVYCLAGAKVTTGGFDEKIPSGLHGPTLQVYPNPSEDLFNITINLEETRFTRLDVYDSRGILIQSILNEKLPAGKHELTWDISHLNLSGNYFLKLKTEKQTVTAKLLIITNK